MADFDSRLIELFRGEIEYLRKAGADFGTRYPKIAGRLELSGQESSDPQIERLLESFAFLSARIQTRIEDQHAEIPAAMLEVLHPYLIDPIPPMGSVCFRASDEKQPAPSGRIVPRGTPLYAQSAQGAFCRFRTCYDVDVRPIEISEASIEPVSNYSYFDTSKVNSVLKIKLRGLGLPMSDIPLETLRIHLSGDKSLAMDLYELVASNVVSTVFMGDTEEQFYSVPHSTIKEVGFREDQSVLPDRKESSSSYRLLLEYFSFPEKFLYFDVTKFTQRPLSESLTLLFGLDRPPSRSINPSSRNFLVGCSPVINLFPKTLEPVRLNHTDYQYNLQPELGAMDQYEIHSIDEVSISSPAVAVMRKLEPYYGIKHEIGDAIPKEFWFVKRSGASNAVSGSQCSISFVDVSFNPKRPAGETAKFSALCTNRAMTEQIPVGAILQGDEDFDSLVTLIKKPTPTVYPPTDGATLWRLISQLSLNKLSFSNAPKSIESLREILRLYCPDYRPASYQEVMGLKEMDVTPVVRRINGETWRGFCRGSKVLLKIDERNFVGGNPYMLGSILSKFLGLHASLNSFVELEIQSLQKEGPWKKWQPVIGEQGPI